MDNTIRIFEGTAVPDVEAVPATAEELLAELMLPERLVTLQDRCDQCRAEALHAFVFSSEADGLWVMLTCNHHGLGLFRSAAPILAHRDYRVPYEQFVAENEAQQAEALKQIAAGKLDDSNYSAAAGTGAAAYKSQWDRREGFNLWQRPKG